MNQEQKEDKKSNKENSSKDEPKSEKYDIVRKQQLAKNSQSVPKNGKIDPNQAREARVQTKLRSP